MTNDKALEAVQKLRSAVDDTEGMLKGIEGGEDAALEHGGRAARPGDHNQGAGAVADPGARQGARPDRQIYTAWRLAMTVKWIGILLGLALAFGAGYHFGGLAPKLAQAKAQIKQETAAQTKDTKDQATVAQEARTYEAATDPLLPVAAPAVRVCHYTPVASVPSADPAGSGTDAAAPVRAANPPDPLPGPDIGRPLVQIGHNADAQIAGLQDYIEHVCQARAP
jgi:hypothetical protein